MKRNSIFTNLVAYFLVLGSFFVSQITQAQNDYSAKKQKAITSLAQNDSIFYSVQEAMREHDLKSLSVAVIDNYEIVWTETQGVKDVKSQESVNKNTAYSTASISKAMTATLFAMLEEKGLIDLKAPVSKYLKRWQLPESEFLKDTELTLEHLLSHTVGTTQHGFTDFYEGDTIPTILESLQGKLPHYDKEISFKFKPATNWSYSGGGYVIAQMAVENELGKSLANLAYEYILKPLKMKRSTMKQPNETGFLKNVAKAHDKEGKIIRTGIPITPQVSASGLWSTLKDMAKFIIEIQKALKNDGNSIISYQVAKRVTKIVSTHTIAWSLGWERYLRMGNHEWFSHGGANTGTGGHIYGSMEGGKGIIFFGNSANSNRLPVLEKLRNSIVKTHNWHKPLDVKVVDFDDKIVKLVSGIYKHITFEEKMEISLQGDKLIARPSFRGNIGKAFELIYLGNAIFTADEAPHKLKFEKDSTDGKTYILMLKNDTDLSDKAFEKLETEQ